MKTEVQRQIAKLRLPLFAAPMFLISGPELVIEVCKSGSVGAFPTPNARTTTILDEWVTKIEDALDDGSDQSRVRLGPAKA